MSWKMAFSLPNSFSAQVLAALEERGVTDPAQLAPSIKKLSDFYATHAGEATPWHELYAIPAYLAYFQPLNFVRLLSVWREVKRFLPESAIEQVWDFGSGLGVTQWVLEHELPPRPLFAVETNARAVELHKEWAVTTQARWQPQFTKSVSPGANALAVFSYSFLEIPDIDLSKFTHLLIVEPSTREAGRDLMQARADLMGEGFRPLAPCTHSEACPLLTQSQRDWCHMRVHFDQPEWFAELEAHLPMKNQTLTYSYLLMSRTVKDTKWRGAARVIGDTLPENGKTKQMICRGPQREFVSWLHRYGEPPRIPHGALLTGTEICEPKGQELRAKPDTLKWEI